MPNQQDRDPQQKQEERDGTFRQFPAQVSGLKSETRMTLEEKLLRDEGSAGDDTSLKLPKLELLEIDLTTKKP